MKILLTGANGFLGSILYNSLKNQNKIFKLSRNNSNYNYCLKSQIPIFNENFDLIIHAAGKAHSIPKSMTEINDFYNINVQGTINLLDGLSKTSLPKKFIFISTVSVYGLISGININEDAPLLAVDPYGKSKIEAEKIVCKWCYDNNIICTILRLPLVVGKNPPGNLGSMIQGISKGYYFNIDGGNAKKSMVLASDISTYILNMSEIGGIYNLTDGVHPTFNELSIKISSKLGRSFIPNLPYLFAYFFAKVGDLFGTNFPFNTNILTKITSSLTFDDTKARRIFNWNPKPVLEHIPSLIK